MTNGSGKSDSPTVPRKSPNNDGQSVAEGMEGKGLAKGNLPQQNASRTPSRNDAPGALERVRQAAKQDKKLRFTALLHHIHNLETLLVAYFNFLGFTHIFVTKRSDGMYTVLRQTIRKRLQTKLNEVKAELQRRMHQPIPKQGKWLQAVVRGHLRYYGVPMNTPALALFRFQTGRLWHRALSRRSQNGRVLWTRMRRLIARWLPLPTVCHPYPLRRMGVVTEGKSRMREIRSSGSVEGVVSNHDPSDY
jgi:hypothetical protein